MAKRRPFSARRWPTAIPRCASGRRASLRGRCPHQWAEVLARRALADRSVQVRRAALAVVAPTLSDEEARPLLEAALLDTHTTARWQARALVLARGPFDLAGFYRRVLAAADQPALVRGALLGLGESGTADDVARVVPFLSADRLRVRCAALRARADLEPLSATEPYLAALRSAEPGTSREARRALEPRLSHVAVAVLHAFVVDGAQPPHTRRNALSLAYGKSKWEKLPVLLDACVDPIRRSRKWPSGSLTGGLLVTTGTFSNRRRPRSRPHRRRSPASHDGSIGRQAGQSGTSWTSSGASRRRGAVAAAAQRDSCVVLTTEVIFDFCSAAPSCG